MLIFPKRNYIHEQAALTKFGPFERMSVQPLGQEDFSSFLWNVAGVSLVITNYVHTKSLFSVDKKTQLDVTFVFFISLLIVAQHVSGNDVPIIRSWRLRDVIASCRGCRKVVKTGWQVERPWMGSYEQHIPTRGDNITQSSAPDDGHIVTGNMLSN